MARSFPPSHFDTDNYARDAGSLVYPPHMSAPGDPVPVAVLSVSDVERLAKAGVKMDWAEIKYQVRSDQPQRHKLYDCEPMLRPLIERLRMRSNIKNANEAFPGDYAVVPFNLLSVSVNHEKVYVFVAPHGQPPVILEDDVNLYPSDALMAKLHLMDKLYKEK